MFFLNNHGEHGAVPNERGTEDTENRCILRVLRGRQWQTQVRRGPDEPELVSQLR